MLVYQRVKGNNHVIYIFLLFSLRLRFGNKAPSKMLSSHLKASNFGQILLSKGAQWCLELFTINSRPVTKMWSPNSPDVHVMIFLFVRMEMKSKSLDFSNASCYVML